MPANSLQITQGTQNNVATDLIGGASGTHYPYVKVDIGTNNQWFGTLLGGTFNVGTFVQTSGTLNIGTVDAVSLLPSGIFGTTINSGTSTLGTIRAAGGAGTKIYITDITISVQAASNVVIGDGASATPLIGTLFFAGSGGFTSNFRLPRSTSANTALTFQQSANTSMSISAHGFNAT